MNPRPAPSFPVVAVGTSAGGVEALWALLHALPHDLDAAVLVVMHMAPHSQSNLDRVLAQRSALPVKTAALEEPVRAGQVYVAQVDHHLILDGATVRSTRGPRECRVRPAANVLLRSVAESCGPRALGVVLTGALDDGTAGLWALKQRGGLAFVQDPAEAMYDSMPQSALDHVAADFVAPLAELAGHIAQAVQRLAALAPEAAPGLGLESRIAAGETVGEDAVRQLGTPSRYACPECHGVLTEIREGRITRFRCHTGHAYSQQALAAELDQAIEDSVWNTIRALEERLLLIDQAARADPREAAAARRAAIERQLQSLRVMAMGPQAAAPADPPPRAAAGR